MSFPVYNDKNLVRAVNRVATAVESLLPVLTSIRDLQVEDRDALNDMADSLVNIESTLEKIVSEPPITTISGGEVTFGDLTKGADKMFRAQDDHADQPIVMSPVTATDALGKDVTLTNQEMVTSDSTVVDVIDNPDASVGGKMTHIVGPGSCTLTEEVTDPAGVVHVVNASNFAITVGPPTAFTGGAVSFGDLVDDGT